MGSNLSAVLKRRRRRQCRCNAKSLSHSLLPGVACLPSVSSSADSILAQRPPLVYWLCFSISCYSPVYTRTGLELGWEWTWKRSLFVPFSHWVLFKLVFPVTLLRRNPSPTLLYTSQQLASFYFFFYFVDCVIKHKKNRASGRAGLTTVTASHGYSVHLTEREKLRAKELATLQYAPSSCSWPWIVQILVLRSQLTRHCPKGWRRSWRKKEKKFLTLQTRRKNFYPIS